MGDKNIKKILKEKFEKRNKNNFKTIEVLFLIFLTALVGVIIGYLIKSPTKTKIEDKNIQEIVDNYNYIINNYYEDVDKDKLLSGAIEGMINSLDDDYSKLISEEGNSTFYATLEGSYEGIGVQIYNDDNNNIVVLGVLDASPAKEAGIESGDIIKKIDDKILENTDISALTKYIKDNEKESYNVVIERNNIEKTLTIKKSTVTIKSVSSKLIEKENHKIGYIYISIFSNQTASQFKKILDDLEKQNIDSLIIDVRENTGGHLTTVTEILSELLDSNNVIYQIEKNKKVTKYYSTGTVTKKYPIVILQNKNSASASELLSAALKESYGATIVGENSYGKGTVQEMISISNGDNYKFTTKKWLTPDGNWINKKGVEADIKVSLNESYLENPSDENDNQLQEAINVIVEK